MKKLIAAIAIIGIVFSSCNGKYTIAKRKYNKGFYVSKGSSTHTKPTVAPAKAASVNAPEEKIETVVVAKSVEVPVEIAPVKEAVSNEMRTSASPATHSKKAEPVASATKNDYTPANDIKPVNINPSKVMADKGKSNGNLVLMIILCFFWWLNLIAVYMHDGGITTNFWVTLLLDIIIIGGIIFALLVVLDVVDLS